MDSKCHDMYQLKEASVVLTKLNDNIFSHDTLTVLSDDDANESPTKCENGSAYQNLGESQAPLSTYIIQGSRKRKRKNEAPQRKIMKIDDCYDADDDIYKTYSVDRSSLENDTDVDYCFTPGKIPSRHYLTITSGCGNNNANEGEQNDNTDSDKPKFYKTPIFIMKSKSTRSPDDSQQCLKSSVLTGITDPVTSHSHVDSLECDVLTTITNSVNLQNPDHSEDCQINSINKPELTCHVSQRIPQDSLRGPVNSEVQNEIINPVTSTTINSDPIQKPTTNENSSKKVVLEKDTKEKKERKVPNILSRAKRTSMKPLKLKDTSSSLVEIRPKPHENYKLTTATRALLDEKLNKHVVSPINCPVLNSTLPIILKDASDEANSTTDNNQTQPKSSSAKSMATSLSSISQVVTSSNIPLTVNKYALSTTVSTAIKPSISKPQYSSRLRSKSGTKYIVRKDSIISTNISDFLEPAFSSRLTKECGSRLILKLPEKYLNEKTIFRNFSSEIQSKKDTASDSEVQGSSGLQRLPVNVSPSVQIPPAPKSSPILKLTHSKEDSKCVGVDERPIFLQSKGGLDDIMQELNMMNPDLMKSPDAATKANSEQTEANFQMIIPNKERKFSVKQITPTGLFLSNLKGRLMTHTKPSKTTGSLSVQDITEPRIVQTFSMQQAERHEKDRSIKETIFNDLHQSDDLFKRKKNVAKSSKVDNFQVNSKMNKLQWRLNKTLSAKEHKSSSDNSTQKLKNISNQQELNCFADDQSNTNGALPYNGFQQKKECESSTLSQTELTSTTYQSKNEGLLSVTQIKQEPVDAIEGSKMKPEGEENCKIKVVNPNVLLNDSNSVFLSTNEIKSEHMESNKYFQNGNEKNKLHTYKSKHIINQTEQKPIVEPNKIRLINTTEIPDGRAIVNERNHEYKFDDHAYTRSERESSVSEGNGSEMYTNQIEENSQKIPITVQEFETDTISEALFKAQNSKTSPKLAPIPVFAVRCGEKVVLFPASKAVTLGKPTTAEILPKMTPTPTKSPKKASPSKTLSKISIKKPQSQKQKIDFVKKCDLSCSQESKAKMVELGVKDLVTRDFKNIIGKRPKNSMKHMCAVVIQITRSVDSRFIFSKDVLALSFTNGSNPILVRWHKDGIHAALVTFNNKGKIQHLTVDRLLSGFYCLNLKNDPVIRKSRTFEGLLTSTLPNEDLLHSEKDFLAVGEIKSIMDPTLRKPDIKPSSGMTLTEALSDVLPKDLMQMYNPAVSDRSYKPKVHDKSWYSLEKFESFTRTYGRKRGYHTNGCRLPGEEVVN